MLFNQTPGLVLIFGLALTDCATGASVPNSAATPSATPVADTPPADPTFKPILALVGSHTPVVDEVSWLAQLLAKRPELLMQHEGSIKDPAWQALVINPKYRGELLDRPASTWETIVERDYDAALRERDAKWASDLRTAQEAFAPVPTIRAIPSGGRDAAYVVGDGAGYDAEGLDYKVFLTMMEFERSLTAVKILGFAVALDSRGFSGDFKIGLLLGLTRYDYNQVVIHAPSPEMGLCAEAVAMAYFGDELAFVARGVDVVPPGGRGLDWHHFLLTGRYASLPRTVQDYVAYRTPIPAAVCPVGP